MKYFESALLLVSYVNAAAQGETCNLVANTLVAAADLEVPAEDATDADIVTWMKTNAYDSDNDACDEGLKCSVVAGEDVSTAVCNACTAEITYGEFSD